MFLEQLMTVRFRMMNVLAVLLCGLFYVGFVPIPMAANPIANPESYFPARIGSVWHYQGTRHERKVQLTATKTDVFMNRGKDCIVTETPNNVILKEHKLCFPESR